VELEAFQTGYMVSVKPIDTSPITAGSN
jgi:hypothetical protein